MRARKGFTLAEVAVAALIIAIMAAVSAPSLVSFLDNQRAKTTASTLSDVATGIASFRTSVTVYPLKVSQLTNLIATNQFNSCHTAFSGAQVTNWTNNAPFVTFFVSSTSKLNTPIGTINDSLARTPMTANPGTIAVQMTAVDSTDAAELDKVIDGTSTPSTGVLQYTTPGTSVTVSYFVPVGKSC